MHKRIAAFFVFIFAMGALADVVPSYNDPYAAKQVVKDFYQMAFSDHKPKEAAEKYLSPNYKQHNPHVADGRQLFIDYFVPYFKQNVDSKSVIKRVIGERNLVVVHSHSTQRPGEPGRAVMDIFRVENGKIVEHWDVVQDVPAKSANQNSMF